MPNTPVNDKHAVLKGKNVKIIWPRGEIEYADLNHLIGITKKYGNELVRPLAMIYIDHLPAIDAQGVGRVTVLARLAKAGVCIPVSEL